MLTDLRMMASVLNLRLVDILHVSYGGSTSQAVTDQWVE